MLISFLKNSLKSLKKPKMSTPAATAPLSASNNKQETYWIRPKTEVPADYPVLKLFNSLTHDKVEFIPRSPDQVTWYSCGPTVYNVSHMGHARNYVTIDINRRILEDYFNYNVKFVQNVTDIDDKIIIQARREYLFDQYTKPFDGKITGEFIAKAEQGVAEYAKKNVPEFTGDLSGFAEWSAGQDLKAIGLTKPKFPMHVKAVNTALSSISQAKDGKISYEDFASQIKDVIVPILDREKGATVTDPAIFRNCSAYWEARYDEDMRRLNVRPPTIVTRVSEYIPEIVSFVAKIVDQGYAYATKDGSVYFNTAKFDNDPHHFYAKCQPWSKGDMDLIEDGEGSLSLDNRESKLNPSDFALWKASKAGEPAWDSPWGQGRPGWHIECSVMASDFFGEGMDIHSGGIDLAFPHHDNEMAQSEAHFDCQQWVDYFLHTGHLHIEGQKMSKSLKNFITIDEALAKYTAREMRMCFALVQWNNPMDFKQSLIQEAKSMISSFGKFFQKVRALNAETASQSGHASKKYGPAEKELFSQLGQTQKKVHAALCDNLGTPVAIRSLADLVSQANTYIAGAGDELRVDILIQIVYYVTRIMDVFGFDKRTDRLGWQDGDSGIGGSSVEDVAMPYVQLLSKFRDSVRENSITTHNTELLKLCDELRDKDLLSVNVVLDDRSKGQASLVKFVSDQERDELVKQQQETEAIAEAKRKKKEAQKKANDAKELELKKKASIEPEQMFKDEESRKLYSEWDEKGIPTKDASGEELSKSAQKKLTKRWDQQRKLHEKYA